MKIKKKFLSLIALLFPFIISIGFASWIIVYTIEFNTEYQKQPVSELYGLSQSVVYNGEGQVPMPLNGVTLESLGISEDEITYTYKLTKEKENVFNDNIGNKPIDVGEYDVRISINDNESDTYDGVCQVKFTITKRQIKLSSYLINVNYGELSYDNIINDLWNIMLYDNDNVNIGERTIQFLDKDGLIDNTLPKSSYTIKSIHNGLYYYGEEVSGLTEATRLIGSTYVCTIELNPAYKNNYEFIKNNGIDGNKIIIKYKTALIGSTYYTIEEAISSGQSPITLAGDSTDNSSYVETCFTALSNSDGNPYGTNNFTISTGKTLIVPFTNSTAAKETSNTKIDQKSAYVYSVLRIPEGITLNVYGNLYIGARIHYALPSTSVTGVRGVLVNDGTINCFENSSLESYGYTKGDGIINLEKGAKAIEVLRVYDFPGGSATSAILNDIFPINTWMINNIACKTFIKEGSKLYGFVYLYVRMDIAETPLLIGTTSDSSDTNCIFKSNGQSGNYILKYAKSADTTDSDYDPNSLNDITGNNQMPGNRTVLEIKGSYTDSTFKIRKSVLIMTIEFSTSPTKSLPIGFLDIIVKSGSNLDLKSCDYLFLPGSKVVVENGAKIDIASGIDLSFATVSQIETGSSGGAPGYMFLDYCVDAKDAEFVVNGQLNVKGNIGGKIQSSNVGSVINYTSESAKAYSTYKSLFTTAEPYFYEVPSDKVQGTFYATGRIGTEENGLFSQGNYYIYTLENNIYYWKVESNVTTFTINFYDSDKTTLLNSISIGVPNSTYIFDGSETDKPTKFYYEFANWCDWDGNIIPEEGKTYSSTEINVFAQWNEIKYDFNYTYFIENSDGTLKQITGTDTEIQNLTVNIPENYYFTISSFVNNVLPIPATASYTNKFFYGWYLFDGESLNENLLINSSLSFEMFEHIVELLAENEFLGNSIPLCCKFAENQTYDIKIIPNISGETEITLLSKNITDEITLTNYSSYSELDNTKSVKFICWSVYENDTENRFGLSLTVKVQNILDQIDSCNELNPGAIDIENNVLYIYGIVEQKCAVIYQEVNYLGVYDIGTQKTTTVWYLPGQTFNYNVYYQSSINSFPSNSYYFEEYSNGGTIDTTNHTILINSSDLELNDGLIIYYKYYKKCTVTINATNATVTANYGDGSPVSPFVVKQGDYVSFYVEYTETDSRTFTVNGGNNKYSTSPETYKEKIIDDTTIVASSSAPSDPCIINGTLIMLIDGSVKPIEEINYFDKILIFNHETGKFDVGQLLFNTHENQEAALKEVIKLKFDDNSFVEIVKEHVFFDCTLNKYVEIDKNNYTEYLNHEFFATDYIDGVFVNKKIKFIDVTFELKEVQIFCPVTAFHMNCFANGLLIMPSMPYDITGLFNIFELDENMQYNQELKEKDIEKYGIFTYEEFNEFIGYEISYEAYLASPAIYLKVSLEKGLTTKEMIIKCIEYLLFGKLIT